MTTYFYDDDAKRIASAEGILPLSLFKGMRITIHGIVGEFRVDTWAYHHGHDDEEAGLRIYLERV